MIDFVCPRKYKKLFKDAYEATLAALGQKDFFDIEAVFVQEEEIRELNERTRNIDSVTDVLSFPAQEISELPVKREAFPSFGRRKVVLGEIAICEKRMQEQAAEYGHSEEREAAFLFVHGLLHLFGFDHIEEPDRLKMRAKEEEILKNLSLPRKRDA